MPTRRPFLFLTRIAAVPGGLALRANFEVLQMAHDLAPDVAAMISPLQRHSAKRIERVEWIKLPCHALLQQPMYHENVWTLVS